MTLYRKTQSVRYPDLYIKKYKNKVFFNNLWDNNLIESRGHVELLDGTVVVKPFTKVFNRFENGANIPINHMCLGVQKINGFMAAVTYIPQIKEVVVSTTGSLDSPYVDMANEYFTSKFRKYVKEYGPYTFLFEICDSSDPHIIVEKYGAYLIGIRNISSDEQYSSTLHTERVLDNIASKFDFFRPEYTVAPFSKILDKVYKAIDEGAVVYSLEGNKQVLKLKSPYYLGMKKLARTKKPLSNIDINSLPKQFQPIVQNILIKKINFDALSEQDRLSYLRDIYQYLYR